MSEKKTNSGLDKGMKLKKPLSPLQQKLLEGPVMTKEEFERFKAINKWMRKWKV